MAFFVSKRRFDRETFFIYRLSYAPTCIRQNSTVEKRGNRPNGGAGKCGCPHIKKECRTPSKKGEKIHLGRGHVCVELKKHLRLNAGVFKDIWG